MKKILIALVVLILIGIAVAAFYGKSAPAKIPGATVEPETE